MNQDSSPKSTGENADADLELRAEIAARRLKERAEKEASPPSGNADSAADSESAANANDDGELKSPEEISRLYEEAKNKLAELEDKYLRAAAEAENARKRAEAEIARAIKFSVESFARSLLEVRDCLEAAVDSKDDSRAFADGVSLTLKKLCEAMERHKVLEINPPKGAPFDSDFHHAMSIAAPDEKAAPDSIAKVLVKGYTLFERVIRPAGVVVAKESPSPNAEKSGD